LFFVRPRRTVLSANRILTVLATLGSGEHYLFDLLCAVPYAIAVYYGSAYPWHWSAEAVPDRPVPSHAEVCE
jgi:hypothetical protein